MRCFIMNRIQLNSILSLFQSAVEVWIQVLMHLILLHVPEMGTFVSNLIVESKCSHD